MLPDSRNSFTYNSPNSAVEPIGINARTRSRNTWTDITAGKMGEKGLMAISTETATKEYKMEPSNCSILSQTMNHEYAYI